MGDSNWWRMSESKQKKYEPIEYKVFGDGSPSMDIVNLRAAQLAEQLLHDGILSNKYRHYSVSYDDVREIVTKIINTIEEEHNRVRALQNDEQEVTFYMWHYAEQYLNRIKSSYDIAVAECNKAMDEVCKMMEERMINDTESKDGE